MSLFYQPGRYRCQVTSQRLSESKSGNPMFCLTFLVKSEVDPTDEDLTRDVITQSERTIYMVFTAKSVEFQLERLESLGFKGTSFGQLDENTPGFHNFCGLVFDASCDHGEYNGEAKEEWDVFRKGALKILDKKGIRALDAMFGKHLKKNAGVTPPPQSKDDAPIPNEMEVEDIDEDAQLPF